MPQKTFTLNSGDKIPALGYGTWQLRGAECVQGVKYALEIGYRHIDTAAMYGNHEQIRLALRESAMPREELFITSKVWREALGRGELKEACELALRELDVEYLDLYLIHWPNKNISIQESLEAMQELRQQGKIKNIGVSNFTIHHMEDALGTGIQFSVNQVELHPSFQQKELQEWCRQHGIVLTAYSPLARGADLELPVIRELAEKYQRPAGQVVLNWILQKGMIAIPKSATPSRIEENFGALEWDLSPEDVTLIDEKADSHNRMINPEFSEFDY